MPRTWALILILLLFIPGLYAQGTGTEEQPDSPGEIDWADYNPSLYAKGDKTFIISVGTVFPTVFKGIDNNNHGIRAVGGTGALAYNYFINSHVFLGGELSGLFIGTRGGNMFYMIPMGMRAGYQFIFRRFEFPLTFVLGGVPQLYLQENYFGLFLKFGASAFWRFNPDWSFGLNTAWWIAPQWQKNNPNVTGNFIELTLSARYHF